MCVLNINTIYFVDNKMDILKSNLNRLHELRQLVKTCDSKYIHHTKLNDNIITFNTISIVMTSHERSKQVYYTLKTIERSSFKDVQVIIVDDSEYDTLNINILKDFKFNIDLILINPDTKFWVNPCINYNIGFEFIQGGKVIIQNSEVCHVGDVLKYVNENVVDRSYHVFDVKAINNLGTNDIIYNIDILTADVFNLNVYKMWYQHYAEYNRGFHFLTAMTANIFDIIREFSYDYAFAGCYDDDDFIFKVKINNINIKLVENTIYNVGGIHLYHEYIQSKNSVISYSGDENRDIFIRKKGYFEKFGEYIEVSLINSIDKSHIFFNF
jgi:hypothetical protein